MSSESTTTEEYLSMKNTDVLFKSLSLLLVKYSKEESESCYFLFDPGHTEIAFGGSSPIFIKVSGASR
jgi:hypothetical protein